MEESIMHDLGYVMVTNHGGKYAWVDEGNYNVKLNGFTKGVNKSKLETLEIFKKLVAKYGNFERNGYKYHRMKKGWYRTKLGYEKQFVQTRKTY
ncbi:MAG: hypothetical protein WBG90_13685 [Saonia sp.]